MQKGERATEAVKIPHVCGLKAARYKLYNKWAGCWSDFTSRTGIGDHLTIPCSGIFVVANLDALGVARLEGPGIPQ